MRDGIGASGLNEAAELTRMLEQLIGALSKDPALAQSVAWGGISLTLAQVRRRIEETSQLIAGERGAVAAAERGGELPVRERVAVSAPIEGRFVEPTPSSAPSLAGRVQRAPTGGGRVRELLASSDSDSAADALL